MEDEQDHDVEPVRSRASCLKFVDMTHIERRKAMKLKVPSGTAACKYFEERGT